MRVIDLVTQSDTETVRKERFLKVISYFTFVLVVITVGWSLAFFNSYISWPFAQLPERDPLEAAIAEFQQAIELEPHNETAYLYLSQAYKLANQPEKAVEVYQQAIALDTDHAWPYLRLGEFYLQNGEIEPALAAYQQGLELEPENINIYLRLIRLYREQGNFEQALLYAQQAEALEDDRDQGLAHMEQALIYQAQQNLVEADQHLAKAVELAPTEPQIYFGKGKFYAQQGQFEQAVSYYRQAIVMDPNRGWFHLELGHALLAVGQQEEAILTLMTGLSLASNDPNAYLFVGGLAREQEEWSQMVKIYEDALAHGIIRVDIYLQLGDAYKYLGQIEQALTNYQRALELAPDHPEAQQRLTDIP